MTTDVLADAVLAFHVGLFVVIALGVVLMTFRRHEVSRKARYAFWIISVACLGWAVLPLPCILSELEKWFRYQSDPDWHRPYNVVRTVTHWATGLVVPDEVFVILGSLLMLLLLYGILRHPAKGG